MSRPFRKYDFYLEDMIAAADRVLRYTEKMTYAEFVENDLVKDAVIRNFEIIGESAKHIPFRVQKAHKYIPWQHMLALRNFIVHEFFDIDDEIMWNIIDVDLANNKNDLLRLLRSVQQHKPS